MDLLILVAPEDELSILLVVSHKASHVVLLLVANAGQSFEQLLHNVTHPDGSCEVSAYPFGGVLLVGECWPAHLLCSVFDVHHLCPHSFVEGAHKRPHKWLHPELLYCWRNLRKNRDTTACTLGSFSFQLGFGCVWTDGAQSLLLHLKIHNLTQLVRGSVNAGQRLKAFLRLLPR